MDAIAAVRALPLPDASEDQAGLADAPVANRVEIDLHDDQDSYGGSSGVSSTDQHEVDGALAAVVANLSLGDTAVSAGVTPETTAPLTFNLDWIHAVRQLAQLPANVLPKVKHGSQNYAPRSDPEKDRNNLEFASNIPNGPIQDPRRILTLDGPLLGTTTAVRTVTQSPVDIIEHDDATAVYRKVQERRLEQVSVIFGQLLVFLNNVPSGSRIYKAVNLDFNCSWSGNATDGSPLAMLHSLFQRELLSDEAELSITLTRRGVQDAHLRAQEDVERLCREFGYVGTDRRFRDDTRSAKGTRLPTGVYTGNGGASMWCGMWQLRRIGQVHNLVHGDVVGTIPSTTPSSGSMSGMSGVVVPIPSE